MQKNGINYYPSFKLNLKTKLLMNIQSFRSTHYVNFTSCNITSFKSIDKKCNYVDGFFYKCNVNVGFPSLTNEV